MLVEISLFEKFPTQNKYRTGDHAGSPQPSEFLSALHDKYMKSDICKDFELLLPAILKLSSIFG